MVSPYTRAEQSECRGRDGRGLSERHLRLHHRLLHVPPPHHDQKPGLQVDHGGGDGLLHLLFRRKPLPRMVIPKSTIETRGFKRSNSSYLFALRYTLIPTSLILGLGGAPLWSAKCTYLTITGNTQAAAEGKRGSDIISQYFGVFFFLFQSSAVWGNLMSSLIFGQDTKIGANRGREGWSGVGVTMVTYQTRSACPLRTQPRSV